MSCPNSIADKLRDDLDDIASQIDGGGLCREDRKRLNKQAHRLKGLVQWCETRAGYLPQ